MNKDEIIKAEIVRQAQILFKQFGLKKTTMDEIAAACGKAKSTLYHYYRNKEELFEEVLEQELKNLRMIVKEKVETCNTVQDQIREYFIGFHTEALNKLNIFRVLKQEFKEEVISIRFFDKVIAFEKEYLSQMILKGIDKGEIMGMDKKDVAIISEMLLVSFIAIVRYSIDRSGEFNEENLNRMAGIMIPRIFF